MLWTSPDTYWALGIRTLHKTHFEYIVLFLHSTHVEAMCTIAESAGAVCWRGREPGGTVQERTAHVGGAEGRRGAGTRGPLKVASAPASL